MTMAGSAAAIGAAPLVRGYGLAGVAVIEAPDDDAVRAAWRALDPRTAVVILTAAAAAALGDAPVPPGRMVAVLPDSGAPR
jgi:vacuolar-type H+-ATPase subunit F/Vma7